MQQYNNDIENKLRQLENQQLPDLSAMDSHWKEMQATLAPGIAVPRKRSFFNSYVKKLLIAASIVAALSIYFVKYNTKDNNGVEAVKNNKGATLPVKKDEPAKFLSDTSVKVAVVRVNGTKPAPIKIKNYALVLSRDSVKQTYVLKIVDSPAVQLNVADLSITTFYYQIQKPAQEFLINAAKGGEIICKEGTKITVPPAAFVDGNGNTIGGNISINVTEYYKYSDMIAANLTTTSNGEQLVTGGMIKLTALQNNQEVQVRNDKALNLAMPTKNYDPEMQLFLADDAPWNKQKGNTTLFQDTIAPQNFYRRTLNWAVTHPVQLVRFDGKTNFLNMEDQPVRVRETGRKRIGIFHVTNKLPMTTEEARKLLKDKYGDYYDVIKVKKVKPERKLLFSSGYTSRDYIGDSTRLTVDEAISWHYIQRKDSMFYVQKTKADSIKFIRSQYLAWSVNLLGLRRDSLYTAKIMDSLDLLYKERIKVEKAYNFSIKKMGWINCDRFYAYPDKTDFVLDLPADVQADKFVTQLVFTSIRSVMPGQSYKNQIGFVDIPKNMPVYVVGLGEKNGKVVSFMQPLKTSANAVSIKEFNETTPEAFKEKLKQLDL
jgi:hypothetical protein